jgi:hypothetical protein
MCQQRAHQQLEVGRDLVSELRRDVDEGIVVTAAVGDQLGQSSLDESAKLKIAAGIQAI